MESEGVLGGGLLAGCPWWTNANDQHLLLQWISNIFSDIYLNVESDFVSLTNDGQASDCTYCMSVCRRKADIKEEGRTRTMRNIKNESLCVPLRFIIHSACQPQKPLSVWINIADHNFQLLIDFLLGGLNVNDITRLRNKPHPAW